MKKSNAFAMALDVIKHDHCDTCYFDRLVAFTTEFARLSRCSKAKAELFALNYVRERTASITANIEQKIVFQNH